MQSWICTPVSIAWWPRSAFYFNRADILKGNSSNHAHGFLLNPKRFGTGLNFHLSNVGAIISFRLLSSPNDNCLLIPIGLYHQMVERVTHFGIKSTTSRGGINHVTFLHHHLIDYCMCSGAWKDHWSVLTMGIRFPNSLLDSSIILLH